MNRRNRLRFSTDMIATITGVDEPGISLKGRLANVSAHGLSLIVSSRIPTGIPVKVEWGTSRVVGDLVYCKPYGEEYRAGVQVDDPIYDAAVSHASDEVNDPADREITGE
ncbi:MAG: PilZ domain-containing protein [Acidobacteriota bacterium]